MTCRWGRSCWRGWSTSRSRPSPRAASSTPRRPCSRPSPSCIGPRSYPGTSCSASAPPIAPPDAAADLGLRLVHVNANRAEEVTDTVMALFLVLLGQTHLLSPHVSPSPAALSAGCLGSVQLLCCGMRHCRGRPRARHSWWYASARCLATRSLAFRMSYSTSTSAIWVEERGRLQSIIVWRIR
ncbi:hypothetical protein ACQ4PT_039644 [Festuca glaucescens]